MTDFPEFCIRGIRSPKHISPEGEIHGDAFLPDDRTAHTRDDNGKETSINWEDDDSALEFSLNIFQFGVVRVARTELDRINSVPRAKNDISYERKRVNGNDYHGNIVFHSHLPMIRIRTIAATLAHSCSSPITKE